MQDGVLLAQCLRKFVNSSTGERSAIKGLSMLENAQHCPQQPAQQSRGELDHKWTTIKEQLSVLHQRQSVYLSQGRK